MGQSCCTSATLIKEDKKILNFFINLFKTSDIKNYSIVNYRELTQYINQNSFNNFKILNKKQEVRENFVQEVSSLIQREKDINKILFLITILTVLVSKYFEDYIDLPDDSNDFYIDFEQDIFKILKNILFNNSSKIFLYFTAHLYYDLIKNTQKIDIYISSEKYLTELKTGLDDCKEIPEEFELYKQKFLENFGLLCLKSKVEISCKIRNFVLDLIVSYFVNNADIINKNQHHLIFYYRKEKKSSHENPELDNLMKSIYLYLDCYFKYLVKFTNDITTGKKIWKNMEEIIRSKLEDKQHCQMIIELVIMYIFSISKTIKTGITKIIEDVNKCKLIFSTIFEFLCDKLNSTRIKDIGDSSQLVNLNLLYEIIYNHVEILIEDILNERYMQIFARIFIEECMTEVQNNKNEENDKQLLIRLYEITSNHNEPLKLYISLINNTSKLFNVLKEENYLLDTQREICKKLLIKIYIKLNLMLTKYCFFPNYDKPTLERDEFLTIISNFSTIYPELSHQYIIFFTKFFFFIDSHFKIEIDFKHRKNILTIIFDMLFESTLFINDNKNEIKIFDQYFKLIELVFIILDKYSSNNMNDAYLIYRNCGTLLRKINQALIEQLIDSHLILLLFLTLSILNIICKFNDQTGMYNLINTTFDTFIHTIENQILRDNIERLFNLIDQNYLVDCFKIIKNYLNKIQSNEMNSDSKKESSFYFKKIDENQRNYIPKTLMNLHSNFFSAGCLFSQSFDEFMISKGHQAFIREFNLEMTSSNKLNKDFDNMTEHSLLVSNRDFDFFANDSMKIAFNYEERKSINFERSEERKSLNYGDKKLSNLFNSPFTNLGNVNIEMKAQSIEEPEKLDDITESNISYGVENYFKNKDLENIKI